MRGSLVSLFLLGAAVGLRVLHLTDIHFDPEYQEGTPSNCVHKHQEFRCCVNSSVAEAGGDPAPARRFGEYHCDTPLALLESQLAFAQKQGPYDILLWTGDSPPHNSYTQTREGNLQNIAFNTQRIREAFPDTPIVASLGNHAYRFTSQFKPPPAGSWLLNNVSSYWQPLFYDREENTRTVLKGGYYAVRPLPGLLVISLNTLIYDADNLNAHDPLLGEDPMQQFAWADGLLEEAQGNSSIKAVWIIGHIPPGGRTSDPSPISNHKLSKWYQRAIERYSKITFNLYGHSHFNEARIVSTPRVFADAETGTIASLWPGGDHGPGTQSTRPTIQCHDITAYPEIGLAAGACSGNGILFDITDRENPRRIDEVVDPSFVYWHSATFNNDATKVIFTDEWGGGGAPRCQATDPPTWGANAVFEIIDGKLQFGSYYKLPVPQTASENCVAHNGSLVPVPGRDIKVQSWYQGGLSVWEFTDSEHPVEIAFFDRGPVGEEVLGMSGGYWSSYWYNGYIYGSEISRGFDVFKLIPSEHLSQNELDAASLAQPDMFNGQHQPKLVWPPAFVVARAHLDQVRRSESLAPDRADRVAADLDRAEQLSDGPQKQAVLASLAADLEDDAQGAVAGERAGDPDRLRALAAAILDLAEAVR